MVVTSTCDAWLILADHYQAWLWACKRTPTSRCALTSYGSTESPIPDIEYCRPTSDITTSQHRYKENHRRLEEEYHRFGRQLGRWITTCIDRFGIESLTLSSPQDCHATILSAVHPDYQDRIDFTNDKLFDLTHDELCRHPLVRRLVSRPEALAWST